MVATVSRRGLFRAVLPLERAPSDANEPIARVARISESCVETRGVVCRRCGESCESRAITFQPRPGGHVLPLLARERCTGCGDCLPVCPTRAISLVSVDRAALISALTNLETRHDQ